MPVKHASDVEAQPVKGAIKTTIQVLISTHEGSNFTMRRFVLERGGFMPKHTNTVGHEQYVLRGRATISIDGQVCTVTAGDVGRF
jgi:quercetin dioxygenase-like cupin family protein